MPGFPLTHPLARAEGRHSFEVDVDYLESCGSRVSETLVLTSASDEMAQTLALDVLVAQGARDVSIRQVWPI